MAKSCAKSWPERVCKYLQAETAILSFLMMIQKNAGEALDFDWGRIVWLVSGAQNSSQVMTFGRVTIRAGCANPRHLHPNCDEILHLLSGQIEHSLGSETFVMNAGDTISIPRGVVHNARAISAEDAQMVICFDSAQRETQSE